jgi:hypothetical protein
MKIIGIAGEKGCGKDTAFHIMKESLTNEGFKVTQIYFAKPLKDACATWFNWDRARLDSDLAYKEGNLMDDGTIDPACEIYGWDKRRDALQRVGTEGMRQNVDLDFWVKLQKLKIRNGDYDGYDVGFLTDCRFLNELNFVKSMGGDLMMLINPDIMPDQDLHASEMEWKQWTDWDVTMINSINPLFDPDKNLAHFKWSLESRPLSVWFPEHFTQVGMAV